MAIIKVLKDEQLIGGTSNTKVYPVTSTQAVYRQTSEGVTNGLLETSLQDIEDDAQELHSKTEKIKPSLEINVDGVLEINGTAYNLTLQGSAEVSFFGDAPDEAINISSMEDKSLQYAYNGFTGNIQGHESNNKWVGNVTIPNANVSIVPGTCNFGFIFSYNNRQGINVSKTVSFNLRKYFGFASTQPTDPTTLSDSHFSDSVECDITISAKGNTDNFEPIYFAVPVGMSITKVTQIDSLNAPLAISQIGTIDRTISGTIYQYKLYRSTDLINTKFSKQLRIE